MFQIVLSLLRNTYLDKADNVHKLQQSRISREVGYDSFADFVADHRKTIYYPVEQKSKFSTFGFTPTTFDQYGERINKYTGQKEYGWFRLGSSCAETVTLAWIDCDNKADGGQVSLQQGHAILCDAGYNHFIYTTFSHTAAKHKYRGLIEISRPMTFDEAYNVNVVLNVLFNGQLDSAIFNPGNYLYGPGPASTVITHTSGAALDVDQVLAMFDEMNVAAGGALARPARANKTTHTEAEIAEIYSRMTDDSQSGMVSIHNPVYFRPEWFADITNPYLEDSRHQTMFGLLCRCVVKAGNGLTAGDLAVLAREIDAEWGNYFIDTYGQVELQRVIRSAMFAKGTARGNPPARRSHTLTRISKMRQNYAQQ